MLTAYINASFVSASAPKKELPLKDNTALQKSLAQYKEDQELSSFMECMIYIVKEQEKAFKKINDEIEKVEDVSEKYGLLLCHNVTQYCFEINSNKSTCLKKMKRVHRGLMKEAKYDISTVSTKLFDYCYQKWDKLLQVHLMRTMFEIKPRMDKLNGKHQKYFDLWFKALGDNNIKSLHQLFEQVS